MSRLRDTSGEAMAAALDAQRAASLPPAPAMTALQSQAMRGDLKRLVGAMNVARQWYAVRKNDVVSSRLGRAERDLVSVTRSWDESIGHDPAVSPALAHATRVALSSARLALAEVAALRSLGDSPRAVAREESECALDMAQRLDPSAGAGSAPEAQGREP